MRNPSHIPAKKWGYSTVTNHHHPSTLVEVGERSVSRIKKPPVNPDACGIGKPRQIIAQQPVSFAGRFQKQSLNILRQKLKRFFPQGIILEDGFEQSRENIAALIFKLLDLRRV